MVRALAAELLAHQHGVVSRRQLIELGATEADVRRWLRRRELVVVHPGVYAAHTGALSWTAQAWAAVLLHWPAVLADASALRAFRTTPAEGPPEVIHVAVDPRRRLTRRPGIRLHGLDDLGRRALWQLSPPRLRFEDALLRVCAATADRTHALAQLMEACRQRRTTPARLRAELQSHPNLRHRAWLVDVLRDTADGVQSVLEQAFLVKVERAHGLPRGTRQLRAAGRDGTVYRDVVYVDQGVILELDGRIGHESNTDRWADMDRDLDAAVDGLLTIRIGWRHAEQHPCTTAARLASLLRQRGWAGTPHPCGPNCALARATPRITDTG